MALEFSEADLNVSLVQEGRDYSEHFQMYKFYFSMRMTFSQDGDSMIFVGDLLNIHGDVLDRIFGTMFRACVQSGNLQHFNRNEVLADDFIQFTIEYSDLHYATLVDGLKHWLSNLAQSNRQMNVDNDWAISLQISRTSEVPRGFGKTKKRDFGLQSKVKLNVREFEGVNSPVFDPDIVMDMQVPPEQGSSLQWDEEERELFGSVSYDDGESSSSSDSSGEDEYDDDSGMLQNINCPLHNENALTFL